MSETLLLTIVARLGPDEPLMPEMPSVDDRQIGEILSFVGRLIRN